MTAFVQRHFEAAGWTRNRSVPISGAVPADHPAASVLRQFAGLTVGAEGAGEECAISAVAICHVALGAEVGMWEKLLRSHLVGVAQICEGHAELFLAEDGRSFGWSSINNAFYYQGQTFYDAVERILRGRRALPMLRPGQEFVSLYGDLFRKGDAALYAY